MKILTWKLGLLFLCMGLAAPIGCGGDDDDAGTDADTDTDTDSDADACDPTCDANACMECDLSGETPACVSSCGENTTCEAGECVAKHDTFAALTGPFADGPAVTTACLTCHSKEGDDFMKTSHWTWIGETPDMVGHEDDDTVGKNNLINNFCIAVVSNEKRCSQCHAGYGMENKDFDYSVATNIDCLICHADPSAGYKKEPKLAGAAGVDVDLAAAAQSVGLTTRANCGSCHFGAGGGDNVKKGDIGSALADPTEDVDFHMGNGTTCSDCHAGDNHVVLGQGVHLPVSAGRIACVDCHTATPHPNNDNLNKHALDIACQTCHIPAFSRTQPTKMAWDWSTAGDKSQGTDGVVTEDLGDGTMVQTYNYLKGTFVWEKNVTPEYMWYDGRVERMTTLDTYTNGQGTGPGNPIELNKVVATHADAAAKIFPFKAMTGQQPVDPTNHLVLAPKLFGPGGFWSQIPDPYDAATVQANWTAAINLGATEAGQLTGGATYTDADWDWGYTVMYLGINHEVAPKEQALGQTSGCATECHGPTPTVMDLTTLGYSCDPMSGDCGNRN